MDNFDPATFRFNARALQDMAYIACTRFPEPFRATLLLLADEHGIDLAPFNHPDAEDGAPATLELSVSGIPILHCPAAWLYDPEGVREAFVDRDGTVSVPSYDRELVAAVDEIELMMGDEP